MNQLIRATCLCLVVSCYALPGWAQNSGQFENAVIARITTAEAPVYAEPDRTSGIVTRLESGQVVVAYQEGRGFVAIANAAHEPLGYVDRSNVALESEDTLRSLATGSPQQERPETYKNPGTATLLSFLIVGAGQIYVGETGKGLGLFAIATLGPGIGYAASTNEVNCSGFGCTEEVNLTPLYVGLLAGGVSWLVGLASAGNDAREANREAGFSVAVRPGVQPVGGSVRPGVRLSMRW